ncbi:RNA ligase family protein [Candidatus Thiosymbion oneisti]|uniref:RNA ligase family protein n=1 Tax=Candidatus Thiosymbion oneisti TaxID=589554 RepID=UPI00105DB970|nr:RNA ligase family protein [Candidatus Thiosymbion oneisti]
MKEYHKIQTVYKRDPATKHKTLIEGDFSLPEFEFLQHNKWIFTEKVDGTNVRVIFDGETITFGGKTDRAQIPAVLMNRLNEKFLPQTDNFKEIFNGNSVCLYGEGYGAKVQPGGGKYRQDPDFVLFDVKIDEWWLQRRDVEDIAEKLGTDTVPIIGKGTLHEMVEMAKAGFKSQWGDFMAEGVVARPAIEIKSRNGERIMTKIKYKDFN